MSYNNSCNACSHSKLVEPSCHRFSTMLRCVSGSLAPAWSHVPRQHASPHLASSGTSVATLGSFTVASSVHIFVLFHHTVHPCSYAPETLWCAAVSPHSRTHLGVKPTQLWISHCLQVQRHWKKIRGALLHTAIRHISRMEMVLILIRWLRVPFAAWADLGTFIALWWDISSWTKEMQLPNKSLNRCFWDN